MKASTRCLVLALACAGPAFASPGTTQAAAPGLAQTSLYSDTVHGCHAVDLSTWTHPAKRVLVEAGAKLAKVELCNGDRFPVFTAALPFDPEGHTDSYFDKLYAALAEANGFWSYALVDTADDEIVLVSITRAEHELTLQYEPFTAPGG